MPPPPVPATILPSEPVAADTSSPSSSTGIYQQASNYPPDASNAEEEGSVVKCAFCNAAWSYPPPDTRGLDEKPPVTFQEMQQKMHALTTFTSNYRARKEADYERWKQRHSGGHCHCIDTRPSSKRKQPDGITEDIPPSKSQKRSSESPPRTSRLTPPPDHAAIEAPSGPLYFEAAHGPRIPLQPDVARVIGPYISPGDDSNNMFYDTHGERKTVKTEETAH